jgi:type II secretory pathway component PulJ
MQLIEVMVAAAVFTAASGSSLQLWTRAAGSSQQVELHQQQLERIELDRLQLQAHWRADLAGQADCPISQDQLLASASALPVPTQLQRDVVVADQDGSLMVRWRVGNDPALQRERMFTPAGLGLCQDATPITDSQVEEVLP